LSEGIIVLLLNICLIIRTVSRAERSTPSGPRRRANRCTGTGIPRSGTNPCAEPSTEHCGQEGCANGALICGFSLTTDLTSRVALASGLIALEGLEGLASAWHHLDGRAHGRRRASNQYRQDTS
jgi:hypothetical protein